MRFTMLRAATVALLMIPLAAGSAPSGTEGSKDNSGRKQPRAARAERPRAERQEKGQSPSQRYTLEQATSDRAQLNTIAFNGLAFLSGDFGASTFIPPGKVCDFFGFQYLRDIDAAEKGHNPIFLNRVVGNVLQVLTDEQEGVFQRLAEKQAPELERLARMRLPLIKAFHMEAEGSTAIPEGCGDLGKTEVVKHAGDIFALDAALSYDRAEAMAAVANSLTEDQKSYLGKMKFGDFNTWPALDERDQMRKRGRGKPQLQNVAFMTYASEFFSWTAGNIEADTYFCPERHGTYFGGFYMKDMPAMGQRDYNISTAVTGDSGEAFLRDVLTAEQRKEIEAIPAAQRGAMEKIVAVRREISTELRKLLKGGVKPNREAVIALGRRYGELDGEVSWMYAMAFAQVNRTLTDSQRANMLKLRNLDGYKSAPYYIYSQAAKDTPDVTTAAKFFPRKKTETSTK